MGIEDAVQRMLSTSATVEILAQVPEDLVKPFLFYVAQFRNYSGPPSPALMKDVEMSAKVGNSQKLADEALTFFEQVDGYGTLSIANPSLPYPKSFPDKTEQELRRELFQLTHEIEGGFCNCRSEGGGLVRCGIHAVMTTMRLMLSDLAHASVILPRAQAIPCQCVPESPRNFNFCKDCGGKITDAERRQVV